MPLRWSIIQNIPNTITVDVTAPGTPYDLALDSVAFPFATLSLGHTPGDDGFTSGTAYSWRMKYRSDRPFTMAGDWETAADFEGSSTINSALLNAPQTFPAVEFAGVGTYYVAIRFQDASGNESGTSNVVTVTV